MPLLSLIIVLIVVGVLLWLVNTLLGAYIDAKILKIINVVVVIVLVLWLLQILIGPLGTIRVG
jgi:hypothetical protein